MCFGTSTDPSNAPRPLPPSPVRMYWNREGFKIGMCSVPAPGQAPGSPSLLCLSNNCRIADTFTTLESRFNRLYTRKAMVHHYTQFMDGQALTDARDSLADIIREYQELDRAEPPAAHAARSFRPLF
jgi:tubulin epsilon